MKARDNPFRSSVIDNLPYVIEEGALSAIVERYKENSFRGALLGPHGSGKTTLLGEIECLLQSEGERVYRCRVRRNEHVVLPTILEKSQGAHLFIDGYDELTVSDRLFLWWRSGGLKGLLVTTHSGCFLPVIEECLPSPVVFARLLSRIVNTEVKEVLPLALHLHRLHKANLRDAFEELYHLESCGGSCLPPQRHSKQAANSGFVEVDTTSLIDTLRRKALE